ncbi:hypothetical protein [Nocardioides renjunii]|uniref:hypothetical protein n=1 Tax=Nocardioides renjunii TaxID=3095075 RepID=UPI002AFF4D9F|nr:hypothetical protein [Nocardioides sp. S-34]WQQ23738.1 hypothetical protein SHK17_07055 [Nocardioides sp. S-34]
MAQVERSRAGLLAVAGVAVVGLLKLTYPYWQLDLPGERPVRAQWDPDLAVRNAFNKHQVALGTSVRMTTADCEEMGRAKGSTGHCVVRYDDGGTDELTLTMLEDGGDFDIEVTQEDR